MFDKLKYLLVKGLFMLPAMLPLPVLHGLSRILRFIIYSVLRYRVKVVRKNLRNALPELSEAERRRIERRFYLHLCDCIVESVKLLCISDKALNRRVEVVNGQAVERIAREGRPVVLFIGHYGCWEWVPAAARGYSMPEITGEIFRPLSNEVMNRVMHSIRSHFNTLQIPQQRAFRELLRLRRDKGTFLIGFLSDQRPRGPQAHHSTMFMGRMTSYAAGGEEIGRRIDAGYLYLDIEKRARGRYTMTFTELHPTEEEMRSEYPYTICYMRHLEQTIRRAPEYWLWSHKRWKFEDLAAEAAQGDA